jgi:hypothetical protein
MVFDIPWSWNLSEAECKNLHEIVSNVYLWTAGLVGYQCTGAVDIEKCRQRRAERCITEFNAGRVCECYFCTFAVAEDELYLAHVSDDETTTDGASDDDWDSQESKVESGVESEPPSEDDMNHYWDHLGHM